MAEKNGGRERATQACGESSVETIRTRGSSAKRLATAERRAAVVGLALRFALSAPPFGLRRAVLRANPTTNHLQTKFKKGAVLIEVRKGTF